MKYVMQQFKKSVPICQMINTDCRVMKFFLQFSDECKNQPSSQYK